MSMTFRLMRAAVLHGKEDVRLQDLPPEPLRDGEVRVAIAAALTCGTDLKVYRRGYHARMLTPPCVFGHEFAGRITELAPDVTAFRLGDRVVAANSAPCGTCRPCMRGQENLCEDLLFLNGAYAESIRVPARIVRSNLLHVPPGLSFADAALTEPLACVVQGIQDLRLAAQERLLVLGCGPIGLMAISLAADLGAEVIAVGRGESRLALASRLGATQVLHNPAGALDTAELHQLQPDAVFEAIGLPHAWESAVQLVRKGGRVNLFGGCPSGTTVTLDTTRIHYAALHLLASFHHTPRTIRLALHQIQKGLVTARDFVDATVPLDAVPDLFRSMAAGNRAIKTLVQPAVLQPHPSA